MWISEVENVCQKARQIKDFSQRGRNPAKSLIPWIRGGKKTELKPLPEHVLRSREDWAFCGPCLNVAVKATPGASFTDRDLFLMQSWTKLQRRR